MPMGIIYVEKRYQAGKPWVNEYPFATDTFAGLPAEIMTLIGAGVEYNEENTSPADGADWPIDRLDVTLVQAVLAFDRLMHFQEVSYTRVYVSDGQKNSEITDIGPLASQFWTQGLAFNGLRANPTAAADIAPLNTVAYVRRPPSTFGQRSGHISFRACLTDNNIQAGNEWGVAWVNDAAKTAFQLLLDTAALNSALDRFFGIGSENHGTQLWTGIGKRRVGVQVPPLDEGDLYLVAQQLPFQVDQPRSRQKPRGRRRQP